MRKTALLLLASFSFVFFPVSSVSATELLTSLSVFNDIGYYDASYDHPSYYGLGFSLALDDASHPVYVTNVPNASGDEELEYHPDFDNLRSDSWRLFGNQYYSAAIDPIPWLDWADREYAAYVDLDGDGGLSDGELLDTASFTDSSIKSIGPVQSVQITGGIHPTISWNPALHWDQAGNPNEADPRVYFYRVRMFELSDDYDGVGQFLFEAENFFGGSDGYAYTYEGDLFEQYDALIVSIEAWNFTGDVVNRSKYLAQHNPVPEPTTMLLFGTGLIGLVGGRRKNTKK